MTLREGLWLCQQCGSENKGRFESCQSCAAARPEQVKFYLPGDAQALTDARLIRDALSGVDWYCSHCGGANPNATEGKAVAACRHCGQARDAKDRSGEIRHYAAGEAPQTAAEAMPARPSRRAAEENPPKLPETRRKPLTLFAALAVFLVLAITWWAWPRHYEGPVTDLRWERSISIERMQTYVETGWDLPPGGRLRSSETKLRSWRDVLDHYVPMTRQVSVQVPSGLETYSCGTTNLGNGYFQDRTCTRQTYRTEWRTEVYQEPVYRKEPVYDHWLSWDIDRWSVVRVLNSKGGATTPAWPEVKVSSALEREGKRTETYVATVKTEEGALDLDLTLGDWKGLSEGELLRWSDGPFGAPTLLPSE